MRLFVCSLCIFHWLACVLSAVRVDGVALRSTVRLNALLSLLKLEMSLFFARTKQNNSFMNFDAENVATNGNNKYIFRAVLRSLLDASRKRISLEIEWKMRGRHQTDPHIRHGNG